MTHKCKHCGHASGSGGVVRDIIGAATALAVTRSLLCSNCGGVL